MACGNKEKRTDRKRYFILIDIRTHKSLNSRKKKLTKKVHKTETKCFLRKTTKLTGAQFQIQIQDPDSTHT